MKLKSYDVFVQFESGADLGFAIRAYDAEHAELLVRNLHPLATDIWITSIQETA